MINRIPIEQNGEKVYVQRHLERTLGANVSRLRQEQGLTKKTFALMSGISRPYLNSIESGSSDVRLSYVQRLADALCVEPIELFVALPEDPETRVPHSLLYRSDG